MSGPKDRWAHVWVGVAVSTAVNAWLLFREPVTGWRVLQIVCLWLVGWTAGSAWTARMFARPPVGRASMYTVGLQRADNGELHVHLLVGRDGEAVDVGMLPWAAKEIADILASLAVEADMANKAR